MVEYPGLAAAICIAQHHRSIWMERQLGADNSAVLNLRFLEGWNALCGFHSPTPPRSHGLPPTLPPSFNEEGKEWLAPIESARTLLSLFSLQKHAHVTLTFFIFFTAPAGENVQTRSYIWYVIVCGPAAFIFHPPEQFGRLTEAETTHLVLLSWKSENRRRSLVWSCCWFVSTRV